MNTRQIAHVVGVLSRRLECVHPGDRYTPLAESCLARAGLRDVKLTASELQELYDFMPPDKDTQERTMMLRRIQAGSQ